MEEANDNNEVELITLAIQKLIEQEKNNKDASANDDRILLFKLLSQLESLKGDEVVHKQTAGEEVTSPAVVEAETTNKNENANQVVSGGGGAETVCTEEIVNELREVKRQNFVTHCLLSAMIALTVAWQFSEMKLILNLKKGLSHPFRSVGNIFTGMIKGPAKIVEDVEKKHQNEDLIPHFALPHMDLSDLGLSVEKH